MVVPYANRTVVASLPSLALASKPATVKEVIADLAKQCPHESVLECVQVIKGRTLRIVFPSAEIMEDIVTGGLEFRSHPIVFKTPSVFKWVTLMDLPYGIPESEIKTALSKFGQIAHVKAEVYMGLYTGTRLVKVEIKRAIPSRVMVAGHLCTVFYRGQVRSCFRCAQSGHEAKNCPNRQRMPPGGSGQREEAHVPPSNDEDSPSGEGMSTDPPSNPPTFAEVVTSPGRKSGTSRDAVPLTSPPEFHLPPVTDSEWTDSDGSEKPQTRIETSTDDSTHDLSPVNKPQTMEETETLTPAVSMIISPDIITTGDDAAVHSEASLTTSGGQPPQQPTGEPSSISNYGSEPIWTDGEVHISPEIPDGQPQKQLAEDLPSMDTSTPKSDTNEPSAKAVHLKTRRRAHFATNQKGKLASCIRQRTAPTLPGKRKAKCQPPPDSPYTQLVTDSGYLVTSTPSGISIARPKRPVTGVAGAVSPSPPSSAHP